MKKNSKTVLQVLKSADSSITSVAYSISEAASNEGYNSKALLLRGDDSKKINKYFNEVDSLGISIDRWEGFRLRLFCTLYKYIKNNRPDIILVHRYKEFALLSLISILIDGPKVVAVFHGERGFASWFRRVSCGMFMGKRNYLIAVSGSVKRYLLEYIPGLKPYKVEVIHNGIDFTKLSDSLLARDEARRELGIDLGLVVYGSVGRLVKAKGTDVLVKAFSEIADLNKNAVLILIGEGGERERIAGLIKNLGLDGRVMMLGNIKEASRFLKAFDYFVFPSVREGFGLALVEAIAAKVPIIFSDLDVFKVLAIEHKYMFKAGDVAALVHKMEEAACDGGGVRGRNIEKQYVYAKEHFSVEKSMGSYRAFISKCLK